MPCVKLLPRVRTDALRCALMAAGCVADARADRGLVARDVPQDELGRDAVRAVARFLAFLALLLFGPAWTLRFPEAWLYWGILAAFSFWCTAYFVRHDPSLIRRRMHAGPLAEHERSQQIIQTVTAVLGIAVFVLPGFDHRLGWSSLPVAVVVLGDALVAAGLLLVFRVFQENGWAASTIQVEDDQPVIRTGPYAWVRHPMYAGSLLLFLATPLALGSLPALVPAVLLCAAVVVRLLDEERFLVERLPGYADYRREVPYRLVPGVW